MVPATDRGLKDVYRSIYSGSNYGSDRHTRGRDNYFNHLRGLAQRKQKQGGLTMPQILADLISMLALKAVLLVACGAISLMEREKEGGDWDE